MERKDHDAAAGSRRGNNSKPPSLCYQIAMAFLFPVLLFVCCLYVLAIMCLIFRALGAMVLNLHQCDCPISASMEIAGVRGLEQALAPGAVSPAFDLLVRVDNPNIYDKYRAGGSVTVSYAGVPLAHGQTPSFRVCAEATATFTVNATTEAIGVPEDLFRLMSAERRLGAAQLEVGMKLGSPGWELYTWTVDLDGYPCNSTTNAVELRRM